MVQTTYPAHEISRNEDHIRTLTIFHYVMTGLYALGLLMVVVQLFFMMSISHIGSGGFVMGFILFGALICIALAVSSYISAQKMKQRSDRKFSIIVAAIQCLYMPFGTALGVFTIIVLTKESVIKHYYNES